MSGVSSLFGCLPFDFISMEEAGLMRDSRNQYICWKPRPHALMVPLCIQNIFLATALLFSCIEITIALQSVGTLCDHGCDFADGQKLTQDTSL